MQQAFDEASILGISPQDLWRRCPGDLLFCKC
jgi:hypothetical protein